MKKILSILILVMIFLLSSCNLKENNHIYSINLDYYFKTINQVKIISDDIIDNYTIKIYEKDMNTILESISNEFDGISNPNSTVSIINKNAGKEKTNVSDEFIEVLKEAINISKSSIVDGKALFDITIAPLWDLWKFTDNYYKVVSDIPNEEDIISCLNLVDYKKIEIDEVNKTVFLKDEKMAINMGGIVKGYASDKIKEYLIAKNIDCAVIDIGSNILLLGNYYQEKTDKWKVYLKTPYVTEYDEEYFDLFYYGYIMTKEATVVTSGSYQKYIVDQDGNKYHHILDPRNGMPFNNGVVSVTVVTDKSIVADGYSTLLFALGLEKGMEFVENTPNLEAIYVIKNGDEYSIYESKGIKVTLNKDLSKYNYNYQTRTEK